MSLSITKSFVALIPGALVAFLIASPEVITGNRKTLVFEPAL